MAEPSGQVARRRVKSGGVISAKRLSTFTSPAGEAVIQAAYQHVLREWTAPYTEHYIPTSFGEFHLIASGPESAPPVILLHAYFATAAVWYPNVGALSKNYRVYAVDILGEANPSRPTRPIASLDDFTACFAELLDGLAIDTADVVGNSFGGFLAVGTAMRIPQRIRSLVLIGPAATFHSIRPFYTHVFLPKAVNLMAPWIPGHTHRTRRSLNWLHAGLPQDPHWAPLFYQVMLHGAVTNRLFPTVFTAQELHAIACVPALLLIGDHERIYCPQEAARAARRLLPGVNIEIIPNAHHITALANPAAVNKSVVNFLARLSEKSL